MGTLVFQATLGGQVNLTGPNTASTFTISVPAITGTMITSGDTGTVTNTMLAGSIANAKLLNSSVTIGSTNIALGATSTSLAGLTTVSMSSDLTLSGGTANGVTYLNGSKVLTSGSALTFDGTKLTVKGGNAGQLVLDNGGQQYVQQIFQTNATTNTGADFLLDGSGNTFNFRALAANMPFTWNLSATAGAPSEQMRLTSTGLGIGTSSPAYKLDVRTSGTNTVAFIVTSAGGGSLINFSDGNTSVQPQFGALANNLTFKTNNAEQMRLDSSGNLGLGVTPSAWGGAYKALQLSAKVSLSQNSSDLLLTSNAYNNGAGWLYLNNGYATTYVQSYLGQHQWFNTSSGTAGTAITFTQAMTLDASGNLLVGTTSGNGTLTVSRSGSGNKGFFSNTTDADFAINCSSGVTLLSPSTGTLAFGTSSTERARIDSSGNLLVGYTTATGVPTQGVGLNSGANASISLGHNGSASGATFIYFGYNGGLIGSVTQSGTTAVLYNVTSDQRLKENIVDAPEFGSVIDSIQVRSYDWKADGTHQRAGFIAQELITVAPEAVHQPENTEEMMAVDYSKLVPMLVKEIQSLRKRLADAGL